MAITNNDKNLLHNIKVKLYPNRLPHAGGEYIARASSEASLSIEQICAALKQRGGFSGRYEDLVNHVRQFFDEAAYQLCDGFCVNTGYFSIHPVIGGTFDSEHESYDPKKHPVKFRFHARPKLRDLVEQIDVTIDGLAGTQGSIYEYYDFNTDTVNASVTPGGMFRIKGDRIRITGDDPAVGVYFIPGDDSVAGFRVKSALSVNTVSKLSGVVPLLSPGSWKIAVKTQYSPGSFQLKVPRLIVGNFIINVS